MPTYTFKCPKCELYSEKFMKMSEFEIKNYPSCKNHKRSVKMQQVFDVPNITIPGNMTYDGITKVVGNTKSKRDLDVPINIIDEKPDGGYRVTRIGSKKDIEND